MNYIETDLYSLIKEKIKNYKGYILFEIKDDDHMANIFHFETKEEFEKNFEMKKHGYYPDTYPYPKNVIKNYGDSVECLIDGSEFYINTRNFYLEVNI